MSDTANDDHPYIIKMPDEPPTSEYGLGYEIFHKMKKYQQNIAQYIVKTKEAQTYAELLDNSIRVAINLNLQNIADDDIVGICVKNNKDSIVAYIAGLFLGKTVAALDPDTSPEDKARLLKKITPKIIFVDEEAMDNLEESLRIAKLDIKLIVNGEKGRGHATLKEFFAASEENVKNFNPTKLKSTNTTAAIFFSSGTSGEAKGICISHLTLLTRTEGVGVPNALVFAQLNWISFALFGFRALRTGTARVLMDDFEINNVWKVVEEYKVFAIFLAVYQLADFANHGRPKNVDTSSLKMLLTGGCTLPTVIFNKMKEVLPEVIVLQSYGLTEIGGPALVFDLENADHFKWHSEKPSTCGTPIKGIWYKIVDPDTEEILGPNKPGELRMKSKFQMLGLYNKADCSESIDSNGWVKTGDILQYDEDHCFFVVDRIKDMIKFRAWTVSSVPLEHLLMEHPAVDKAVVIGVPHGAECDYPMGIVTLKEKCEVDPQVLEKFVEARVPDKQRLRDGVKIVKSLPINSSGKIMKRLVRKMVLDGDL